MPIKHLKFFSVSNYVCNHYFDVVTTSPTYFSAGYHTYTCYLCGYSNKTKGDKKKILKAPKIYSLKAGKKKITVNNSDNKAASGYQIKLSKAKNSLKRLPKQLKSNLQNRLLKSLKARKNSIPKINFL